MGIAARIRTRVLVPLWLADGYATTARVFSFDGLADSELRIVAAEAPQGRTSTSACSTVTSSCPALACASRRRV
jgi:GTP cyclohydrolase II